MNSMTARASRLALAACLAFLPLASHAQDARPAPDPLSDGFRNPPAEARPRTWWHWLNGNITEEGITKDLEWIAQAGLGGVQNFDASLLAPQIVPRRLAYMTPEWKRAFAHAARTADRLGLELAIASSAGWSETGGPWVRPEDGMKKLVWSELEVEGGRRFTGRLAPPPSVTGAYGTAPFFDPLAAFEGKAQQDKPTAYGDAKVIAYPVAASTGASPRAFAGTAAIDAAALTDQGEDTVVEIVRGTAEAPATITLAYPAARTMRAATFYLPNAVPPFGDPEYLPVLEARDGTRWRRIATLPLTNVPTTIAFAPVTAAEFRIVLAPNPVPATPGLAAPAPGAIVGGIFPEGQPARTIRIGTFRLSEEPRIDRFESKAGFATVLDFYALDSSAQDDAGIDPAKVIDLTGRMRPDGSLDWTPPRGRWRIVRLGWSLVGKTNHPATPESTGLEVDKYDGAAVRRYLDTYISRYREAAGEGMVGERGVRAFLTDSIEAGDANWTPRLVERFRELRGYDPTPWLPALTGAVIGSRERSDAFLYDFRRTLADLLAAEHYGTVATVAHRNGLKVYGEALENARPQLGDDMAMRAHADVPMAAMWTYPKGGQPRPTLVGDILGAASVAHVYGQNLVAAESFTSSFSPWAFAPSDLRHVADLEFALGVNRPVIHTSVHSPPDDKLPGLSLAIFGQYFNRHESWAGMARPWVDYLARTSFLLQQGRHVADVAYFYGEEAPITALFAKGVPADLPVGHGFDFVNAGVLADGLSVGNGELVTRGGARYRALYLGGSSRRMTLPTLRRIAQLVEQGATVIGEAPADSPALGDDPAKFAMLVRRLWSGGAETRVGKGRVIAGHDPNAGLAKAGVAPDFTFSKPQPDSEILFQHRRTADGDLYFLTNRRDRAERVEARFRVRGKPPELWRADNGTVAPLSYRTDGEHMVVPLDMAPGDSFFVVFRAPATAPSRTVPVTASRTVATLDGPWQVAFQPGRGAPASIRLERLVPLDTYADKGVRYFSGVATYTGEFTLPGTAGSRMMLDLGRVGDVAEVRVNGQQVGTVWHTPYRLDLGKAARPGRNRLEVRVANLWVNRLIGDAQPGAEKITYTALPTYRPDAPLRPSGLIGPVTVIEETSR